MTDAHASSPAVGGLKDRHWDVIVIGAGPGGSLTAYELARRGRSVLLVEKSVFPRWKVCGACLGASGILALEQAGLASLLDEIGTRAIRETRLLWKSRCASIAMRRMVAVSRRGLDTAIAHAAMEAGAEFLPGVRAEIGRGAVLLHHDDRVVQVRCRSVVQAGGLRSSRRDDGTRIAKNSWIGLGATGAADDCDEDRLTMAVGQHGYVGRIVTEDRMVSWAAAVDPAFVRACGGPGAAIASMCTEAGVADQMPPRDGWVGTPLLTRRARAQDGAVYRVGDASAYVEPITGEGMSWALLGATLLAPILDRALATGTHSDIWMREHARLMRWRRLRCAAVSRALRSGVAMGVTMALLRARIAGTDRLINRLIGSTARWRRA